MKNQIEQMKHELKVVQKKCERFELEKTSAETELV